MSAPCRTHAYFHSRLAGHMHISIRALQDTHAYFHSRLAGHTCIFPFAPCRTHMHISIRALQDTHAYFHSRLAGYMHISIRALQDTHAYFHSRLAGHTCIFPFAPCRTHMHIPIRALQDTHAFPFALCGIACILYALLESGCARPRLLVTNCIILKMIFFAHLLTKN